MWEQKIFYSKISSKFTNSASSHAKALTGSYRVAILWLFETKLGWQIWEILALFRFDMKLRKQKLEDGGNGIGNEHDAIKRCSMYGMV